MSEVDTAQLYAEYEKNDKITVVPGGRYRLRIVRANVKGAVIITVCEVVGGTHDGERVYPLNLSCTEKARGIFFMQLDQLGYTKEFFARSPTLGDIASALVGKVLDADLVVDDHRGQRRNMTVLGSIELVSAGDDPYFLLDLRVRRIEQRLDALRNI